VPFTRTANPLIRQAQRLSDATSGERQAGVLSNTRESIGMAVTKHLFPLLENLSQDRQSLIFLTNASENPCVIARVAQRIRMGWSEFLTRQLDNLSLQGPRIL